MILGCKFRAKATVEKCLHFTSIMQQAREQVCEDFSKINSTPI